MGVVHVARRLNCPTCKQFDWHDSYISPTYEVNECRNCSIRWRIDYENSFKLYGTIIDIYIDKIQSSVEEVQRRINTHKWSKNMGLKDMNEIDVIRMGINHIGSILKTMRGE